jgi:hypothetical protein
MLKEYDEKVEVIQIFTHRYPRKARREMQLLSVDVMKYCPYHTTICPNYRCKVLDRLRPNPGIPFVLLRPGLHPLVASVGRKEKPRYGAVVDGGAKKEEEHSSKLQPGVDRPGLSEAAVREDVVDNKVRA